jgi:hypothetical protein
MLLWRTDRGKGICNSSIFREREGGESDGKVDFRGLQAQQLYRRRPSRYANLKFEISNFKSGT